MATVVLVLIAASFLTMGLYALVAPVRLVRPFNIRLIDANARAEVRAVYGGFGVAIAALLGYTIVQPDLRPGAVVAVAVALLGMAFGRMVAGLVERPSGFYPIWFYCCVELAGAAALFLVA